MSDKLVVDPRGRTTVKHRAPAHGPVAAITRRTTRKRVSYTLTVATVLVLLGGAAIAVVTRVDGPFRLGNASRSVGVTQPVEAGTAEPPPAGGPRVPITPEALLELLSQLVQPTKISNEAKSSDGGLLVQAYLDDGNGPGMIRLGVRTATPGADGGGSPCRPSTEPERICQALPNGAKVTIVTVPDNCAKRVAVSVLHPGGLGVAIDIASCLEFDGTTNPTGRMALTADQAVAIAADPRWQRLDDPDVAQTARKRFPALRRTSLPDVGDTPSAVDPAGGGVEDITATASSPVPTDGALQWEDVDGDSADDYCRRLGRDDGRTGRVACTLSTGTGFGQTITSSTLDWGPRAGRDWEDFNGDNRVDFCRRVGEPQGRTGRIACTLSTGTGFGKTITSAPVDLGADVGWAWDDANNDNTADYCRRLGSGDATNGRLACTLSTGTGFGDTIVSAELDLGLDAGWEWEDVNGDNKTDYCRRLSRRDGPTGRVACTLSTGTGFGDVITSPRLDLGTDGGVAWEDVNGDDKADYCRRLSERTGPNGRVACTLSTGTGFGQTFVSPAEDLGGDAGVTWEDVNGDDRTDYCRRVGRLRSVTQVACTLSTGSGFGATITSSVLDWGQDAGARWVDVNADQKKDYCRRTGARNQVDSRLSCTLSSGTGFGDTLDSPVLDWGLDD